MDVTVRLLDEEDSVRELTLLLNRAYKELADIGLRFVATYQDESITRSRIENAECYVAILPNTQSPIRDPRTEVGDRFAIRDPRSEIKNLQSTTPESQRDSIAEPRVATPGATLGPAAETANNPERVAYDPDRKSEVSDPRSAIRDPRSGGRIVGTILFRDCNRTSGCPWYDRPEVASFGQFGIEPALKGQGIGSSLLRTVESRAKVLGARELALDTAQPATNLIDFYTRKGYRIVDEVQWDVTNYRSVIMSKTL